MVGFVARGIDRLAALAAALLRASLIAALVVMMSIVWVDARVAVAALLWLGGG
jgi:hypothetical protein